MERCRFCKGVLNVIAPTRTYPGSARCIYCGRADRSIEEVFEMVHERRLEAHAQGARRGPEEEGREEVSG